LILNGCFFFGGGSEEEPQTIKEQKKESVESTSPPIQQRPADENRFQDGKYDAKQQIDFTRSNNVLVKGTLNWSKGTARASGYGVPPPDVSPQQGKLLAIEAAKVDAYTNLLGITAGIQIDSTTTVGKKMVENAEIKAIIQGIIRNAPILNREFNEEDQTAMVEVGIVLEQVADKVYREDFSVPEAFSSAFFDPRDSKMGKISTLELIDQEYQYIPDNPSSVDLDKLEKKLAEQDQTIKTQNETIKKLLEEIRAIKELELQKETAEPYTGLVINASGKTVEWCAIFRVYYQDGQTYKLLYGDFDTNRPSKQLGMSNGMTAGLETTLSNARNSDRVKDNPFTVEAISVNTDGYPAISAEDAATIESLETTYHFLEYGKVVIVGNYK
jgi:hypothetical protein